MTGQTAKMVKHFPKIFDEPRWTRLALWQLVLLIHAHKCRKSPDGDNCTIKYCKGTKRLLKHIVACELGAKCKLTQCTSSKELIFHWSYCKRLDCPLCQPIRKK